MLSIRIIESIIASVYGIALFIVRGHLSDLVLFMLSTIPFGVVLLVRYLLKSFLSKIPIIPSAILSLFCGIVLYASDVSLLRLSMFYGVLFIYFDVARDDIKGATKTLLTPVVLALFFVALFFLYSARDVPWDGLWFPSFFVIVYALQTIVLGRTWIPVSMICLGILIVWGAATKMKAITDCEGADFDNCGFGSSKYGIGYPLSNGCNCLTSEWHSISDTKDSGIQICVKCKASPGMDCCNTSITTDNVHSLDCSTSCASLLLY